MTHTVLFEKANFGKQILLYAFGFLYTDAVRSEDISKWLMPDSRLPLLRLSLGFEICVRVPGIFLQHPDNYGQTF